MWYCTSNDRHQLIIWSLIKDRLKMMFFRIRAQHCYNIKRVSLPTIEIPWKEFLEMLTVEKNVALSFNHQPLLRVKTLNKIKIWKWKNFLSSKGYYIYMHWQLAILWYTNSAVISFDFVSVVHSSSDYIRLKNKSTKSDLTFRGSVCLHEH